MGKIKKRAGFTLIEVIVAMGIFFIVLIAFLGSYYSYYRNVQFERYKTIGENLAQLQVEDIQNLAVSVIDSDIIDSTTGYPPNYPSDIDPAEHVYDSGIIDSKFVIEDLTSFPPGEPLLPNSISLDKSAGILTLEKWEFPMYEKKIVIIDRTPELSEGKKIFNIKVIVYWDVGGTEKSITVAGEKSYAKSSLPPT
jgi:prepilin-type N-terminal cleavage/methylation domain-containing protein